MLIKIKPRGAPRITYQGRFSAKAKDYYDWKDELLLKYKKKTFPKSVQLVFYITPPESWSKKKKAAAYGQPHDQKPDIDNLVKAVLDTLCEGEDKAIFRVYAEKYWSEEAGIEIEEI